MKKKAYKPNSTLIDDTAEDNAIPRNKFISNDELWTEDGKYSNLLFESDGYNPWKIVPSKADKKLKREALKHMREQGRETIALIKSLDYEAIMSAGEAICSVYRMGGIVLAAGNGGSAADASHFVSELMGRMLKKGRDPLPAFNLSADLATTTAIANDFGYSEVFKRQLEAFNNVYIPKVVILFSTSGKSLNILEACGSMGGTTFIGVGGPQISQMGVLVDHYIAVPGKNSCRIQEIHKIIIHLLVDYVEENL